MKTPYISRAKIKNFRNFRDIEVDLNHKQVVIGQNNVGKTNFIKALQLILDPTLSDDDRYLNELDFHDSIDSPMKNGADIEISIQISGVDNNRVLLAQLSDALVSKNPAIFQITYKFYPNKLGDKIIDYQYKIYKGTDEEKLFKHDDRKYLNMRVIRALRDVDGELKNSQKSPITHLLKQYDIDNEVLEEIAESLKSQSADILTLDEIKDLETNINKIFSKLSGVQIDSDIKLRTIDIDPNRILYTLKLMVGKRPTYDTSLGLTNILYISLILLLLRDNSIPTFLSKKLYSELEKNDVNGILKKCYELTEKGNLIIKNNNELDQIEKLLQFLYANSANVRGTTILAIEEPEAHLHPTLLRIIYKDVIHKSQTSVLLTTHSTHVASVAPINSIVHIINKNGESIINTTAKFSLDDKEKSDLERYIDAKRGEIYFGRGVILVEGIAEEYLVPKFAELLNTPLDEKGIIICNINSTYFKPYIKYLDALRIPYVVITDGDFYNLVKNKDGKEIRDYHNGPIDGIKFGYLGIENIEKQFVELSKPTCITTDCSIEDRRSVLKNQGIYIGNYTLEVDIMCFSYSSPNAKTIICDVFNELTDGGAIQKQNFKNELENHYYWSCLNKIEANGIGKGRFSQRFSTSCIVDHIPLYIKEAIETINKKVDEK